MYERGGNVCVRVAVVWVYPSQCLERVWNTEERIPHRFCMSEPTKPRLGGCARSIWSSANSSSTHTTMSHPHLSPELLDLVVDFLPGSRGTLKSCCLVSKPWIPRARKRLFADIELLYHRRPDIMGSHVSRSFHLPRLLHQNPVRWLPPRHRGYSGRRVLGFRFFSRRALDDKHLRVDSDLPHPIPRILTCVDVLQAPRGLCRPHTFITG